MGDDFMIVILGVLRVGGGQVSCLSPHSAQDGPHTDKDLAPGLRGETWGFRGLRLWRSRGVGLEL